MSVLVSNLWQMEAIAICVSIGGWPVKLVAVYQLPLRSLVDADLSECISEGTPVLLADDLNVKHKDGNSRRNSSRGVLLRQFATTNSCIVYEPVNPTTIPSCPSVIPDVLDIVIVKDFILPVNLIVCSALSSNYVPVTVDLRGSILLPGPSRPAMLETSRLDSLPGPLV